MVLTDKSICFELDDIKDLPLWVAPLSESINKELTDNIKEPGCYAVFYSITKLDTELQ